MVMGEDITVVEQAEYRALDAHAHGRASRIILSGSEVLRASEATYTTCNPQEVTWILEADRIKLDKLEDQGTARNVWLTFKGVPIFYSPFLSFPLSDQRKSGFLAPGFGVSGAVGVEARVPYYFNIAPNLDATVAIRAMSDRGVQTQGAFRYLFPWGQGSLAAEVLPDDKEREERAGTRTCDSRGSPTASTSRIWAPRSPFPARASWSRVRTCPTRATTFTFSRECSTSRPWIGRCPVQADPTNACPSSTSRVSSPNRTCV
jgi:LPS-assembly protein